MGRDALRCDGGTNQGAQLGALVGQRSAALQYVATLHARWTALHSRGKKKSTRYVKDGMGCNGGGPFGQVSVLVLVLVFGVVWRAS